jgi:hypothetical protein
MSHCETSFPPASHHESPIRFEHSQKKTTAVRGFDNAGLQIETVVRRLARGLHFAAGQKGRFNMKRYIDQRWFRNSILLGALAAGGLMTQLVPAHQETAALQVKPQTLPAIEVRETSSRDMTGIDVDRRFLKFVQSIA